MSRAQKIILILLKVISAARTGVLCMCMYLNVDIRRHHQHQHQHTRIYTRAHVPAAAAPRQSKESSPACRIRHHVPRVQGERACGQRARSSAQTAEEIQQRGTRRKRTLLLLLNTTKHETAGRSPETAWAPTSGGRGGGGHGPPHPPHPSVSSRQLLC